MTETATLEARLKQAEDALHDLLIGAREVSIEYDGGAATYNRASEAGLRQYIREIKRKLGHDLGDRSRRVIF